MDGVRSRFLNFLQSVNNQDPEEALTPVICMVAPPRTGANHVILQDCPTPAIVFTPAIRLLVLCRRLCYECAAKLCALFCDTTGRTEAPQAELILLYEKRTHYGTDNKAGKARGQGQNSFYRGIGRRHPVRYDLRKSHV